MDSVSLVTMTSDRPVALALCQKWMREQDFQGDVQWVFSDDGTEQMQLSEVRPGWAVDIDRRPHSENPIHSFYGNAESAVFRCKNDIIVFIEDDDYYAPGWLSWVVNAINAGADCVGEGNAKYYNVHHRHYKFMRNRGHASLCQTAVAKDAFIPYFKETFHRRKYRKFLDMHLWRHALLHQHPFLKPESEHVVGIKGMPGKGGLGSGHRPGRGWITDPEFRTLTSWAGEDIAGFYSEIKY